MKHAANQPRVANEVLPQPGQPSSDPVAQPNNSAYRKPPKETFTVKTIALSLALIGAVGAVAPAIHAQQFVAVVTRESAPLKVPDSHAAKSTQPTPSLLLVLDLTPPVLDGLAPLSALRIDSFVLPVPPRPVVVTGGPAAKQPIFIDPPMIAPLLLYWPSLAQFTR